MNVNPHDEKTIVTARELRWTLANIKDRDSRITIKLKLSKEGWQPRFHKIIHVSDSNVVLVDEKNNQLKFIDLKEIVQFVVNNIVQKKTTHDLFEVRA